MKHVTVKLNEPNIRATQKQLEQAVELTGEAVLSDVVGSQSIPFDVGTMQNDQTFLDRTGLPDRVNIVTSAPQAQRLYFHPEFDFQTVNNAFAGAGWFEPWISGPKADWVKRKYAMIVRMLVGGNR